MVLVRAESGCWANGYAVLELNLSEREGGEERFHFATGSGDTDLFFDLNDSINIR